MESAVRGRVRASSAIFNRAVTFQLIITEHFLIAPSDAGVFKASSLFLLDC